MELSADIQQAKEIALRDLRACYHGRGIVASTLNFSDYWARDTFWASYGLLEEQLDIETVRSSLELFLQYQRQDGKIPRKICLDYNGLKYLGIRINRNKPRPIYTSAIKSYSSFDDNLLFVIAFCKYTALTNDTAFATKHLFAIHRALAYYQEKKLLRHELLYEIGLGNWMDTIFKTGHVLYTNCLWYEALKLFGRISTAIGQAHAPGLPSPETVLSAIQTRFWLEQKGFFADNVHADGKQLPYFDLAGNVLSLLFDIATPEQAGKIFRNIDAHEPAGNSLLHPINHPLYPWWKISPATYLFFIQGYQNGNNWSWIEALLIAAEVKSGRLRQARRHLENFSQVIIRNGYVHENYYLDGQPFNSLLWKSAFPFAWGAGLFMYAVMKYEKSHEI